MPDRDLFGNLPPPKNRGGRPRRVFSKQDQWLVRAMLRAGAAQHEICARLGCTEPTLRRNFFHLAEWNMRGINKRG